MGLCHFHLNDLKLLVRSLIMDVGFVIIKEKKHEVI